MNISYKKVKKSLSTQNLKALGMGSSFLYTVVQTHSYSMWDTLTLGILTKTMKASVSFQEKITLA